MRARTIKENSIIPKLIGVDMVMEYTGLGRNKAIELGTAAGARVKYGKRVLFDRIKIDKYIDEELAQ